MKKNFERNRFILTLIVVFVALMMLSVFTISVFGQKSREDAVALGESVLIQEHEQVIAYISRALDSVQSAAINIGYLIDQGAENKDILDYLRNQTSSYSGLIDENFTGVYGWINGEYLDGTNWVPDADYVPTERVWYTEALKGGGEPVIVDPYLDVKTNSVMLSISVMLDDKESVLSVDIVMDKFQEIAEEITLGGKGYGFICDTKGLIIAHSNPELKGTDFKDDVEMKSLYSRIFRVNGRDNFEFNRNGIDCTVFADNVFGDWYDVVVIDNSSLYEDTASLTWNSIIASLAIYLLIAFFSGVSYKSSKRYLAMLEESGKKVEEVTNAALSALARAIDAKDKYTQGHSLRVAKYSREIARRMGKNEDEQNEIYTSALLHDVGKIRIPDDIINKPGKLTDEEFTYIKLHTVSGYGILKDISGDRMPAVCARHHHERYDGRGYPSGIAGKEIPEYARIIAVADSYDAMASNRSYRQALPQEVVRSEIEKGKGVQFDPDIADIMLEIIDEDVNYNLCQRDERRRRVLIIDKTSDGRHTLASAFENEPQYAVHTAGTLKDADVLLGMKEIDIILIDENMVENSLHDTLAELRNMNNDIHVLPVVGSSGESLYEMKKLNITDYVTKPISASMLLEIVHATLN